MHGRCERLSVPARTDRMSSSLQQWRIARPVRRNEGFMKTSWIIAAAFASGVALLATIALDGGTHALFGSGPAVASGTVQVKLSKTDVKAPAQAVFELIADFHNWRKWSPHERLDPAMKTSFSGPSQGAGAVYAWDGNEAVGAGSARIAEAVAPQRLVVDFDFKRPVAGTLSMTFTTAPSGSDTKIALVASGPTELVNGALQMFFGGDDLFGIACAVETAPSPICKVMTKALFKGRD